MKRPRGRDATNTMLIIVIIVLVVVILTQNRNPPASSISQRAEQSEIYRRRTAAYPRRQNMGECPAVFGKVTVFFVYDKKSYSEKYRVAQESLECYLKGTNYTLVKVDVDSDVRLKPSCYKHKQAKNTPFAVDFLKKWADYEFTQPSYSGYDNGALQTRVAHISASGIDTRDRQNEITDLDILSFIIEGVAVPHMIHILQTLLPNAKVEIKNCDTIWHQATNYSTYIGYVNCVKLALGANRMWPGKLRIYRRVHGFARDDFLTAEAWFENDFMFHGWKQQTVGQENWESPFQANLAPSQCGNGTSGWNWRPAKISTADKIREMLARVEKYHQEIYPKAARRIPHLEFPDIGECFPYCEDVFSLVTKLLRVGI